MSANLYIRARAHYDGTTSYLRLGAPGGWGWVQRRSDATPLESIVAAALASAVRKFIRVNSHMVNFQCWDIRLVRVREE